MSPLPRMGGLFAGASRLQEAQTAPPIVEPGPVQPSPVGPMDVLLRGTPDTRRTFEEGFSSALATGRLKAAKTLGDYEKMVLAIQGSRSAVSFPGQGTRGETVFAESAADLAPWAEEAAKQYAPDHIKLLYKQREADLALQQTIKSQQEKLKAAGMGDRYEINPFTGQAEIRPDYENPLAKRTREEVEGKPGSVFSTLSETTRTAFRKQRDALQDFIRSGIRGALVSALGADAEKMTVQQAQQRLDELLPIFEPRPETAPVTRPGTGEITSGSARVSLDETGAIRGKIREAQAIKQGRTIAVIQTSQGLKRRALTPSELAQAKAAGALVTEPIASAGALEK